MVRKDIDTEIQLREIPLSLPVQIEFVIDKENNVVKVFSACVVVDKNCLDVSSLLSEQEMFRVFNSI
jgi:hypothetical protein